MRNPLTLILFSAAALFAALSCKPEPKPGDDPTPSPDKKVPVEQTFNVKAGDSVTLEFESYASWTAKADVDWIELSQDKGDAGECSVVCSIGSQTPSFSDVSKGILTITVEGKSYEMTFLREPSIRATRFTDAMGNPVDKLVFDANEGTLSLQLTVEANYYWDLDRTSSPWPSWITDPGRTDGKLDQDGFYRRTFNLSVNESQVSEADLASEITFIDLNDESYKKTLAVEYVAKVAQDQPFAFKCALGTEIHITPSGQFKDSEGKVIDGMYWLDFSVEVEDFSEFKMVYWDACAYDTMWHSSVNMNFQYYSDDAPKFVTVSPSMTDPTNPKAFSLFLFPGAFSDPKLTMYHWNMAYLFFIPERVWGNYAASAERREFFTFMFSGGVFSTEYRKADAPDVQVLDENGSLVHEIKENLRKYAIRIYVDKE